VNRFDVVRSIVAKFADVDPEEVGPETLINFDLGIDQNEMVELFDKCAEAVGFSPAEKVDLSPYISSVPIIERLRSILRRESKGIEPMPLSLLCNLLGIDDLR